MARIKYSTVSIAIISASLSAVVVLSLSSLHHVQSGHSSSYHVVQETRKLEASRRAVMVAMTEPIAQSSVGGIEMPLDSRDSLAEDGEEFDWPIDVGDSNDGKGTTLDGETIPDSGGHVEASTISIGSQKFIDQAATTHGGRGDESKDGEGDELTRLRKRKGADYSEGHQRIYLSMIKLIGGFETIGKAKILEVGVGIGWGLRNILQDVDIGTYVGVEPCERCVDHVEEDVIKPHLLQQRKRVAGLSKKKQALYQEPTIKAFKQTLLQVPTSTLDKLLKPKADFTFCIEVAEHVDPTERHAFLHRIHKYTSHAFFMSTPNKDTRPQHGALNIAQWTELLKDAGFDNVVAIEWQWTVLYIAT